MYKYFKKDVDIRQYSYFHTPAKTRYFFEICNSQTLQILQKVLPWCRQENIPFLIVSSGSNMLFAFDEFPWLIVYNNLTSWSFNSKTSELFSYSAENISDISQSLENDFWVDLWNRFIWLPGSIAGAVYGNAGCFGLECSGNFISCDVIDITNWDICTFSQEDMEFSYRDSKLKKEKKYFLISAKFNLSQCVEKYSSTVDNIYFREHMQPKWYSCGSFFKNPEIRREDFIGKFPEYQEEAPKNISAWYLLECVWLKWKTLWWAYFSDIHANFLMNNWQATWIDLLTLIELAQKKVYETFWIHLENEVQIITP